MKKLFLAGIFPLLAFAPLHSALAQTASSSPDVKAIEKSSAVASSPASDDVAAKNHTTAGTTAGTSAANTDVASSVPSEAQKNFDAGLALYNAGNVGDAILAFKQANKLNPDDALTNYMLGMSYWKLKGYNLAADSFKRAVKIKPDWDEAYFRLGLTYYVLGRTGPSNDIYKKLQELNPTLAAKLGRVIGDPNAPVASETANAAPKPANAKPVEIVPVSVPAIVAPANEKPNTPIGAATSSLRKPSNARPSAPNADANVASTTVASPA
ncbi:MAG: tetratricopeptide repeat protein, partial [bacterium]